MTLLSNTYSQQYYFFSLLKLPSFILHILTAPVHDARLRSSAIAAVLELLIYMHVNQL